jgi:outer membrane protein TolC
MNLILGLPDSTALITKEIDQQVYLLSVSDYQSIALQQRKEFTALQYQDKLADINIKKVQDEKLPSVGLNGSLYYINPTQSLLPEKNSFIAPFLAGINVSWDIGSLLKNKNKLAEVKVQKQEVSNTRSVISDKVKTEVYKAYQQYKVAVEKISLLQTAVKKSEENERVTESRFHNNLATTTERLDAETMLYESRTNLVLATADATLAYYNLLHTSGQLH